MAWSRSSDRPFLAEDCRQFLRLGRRNDDVVVALWLNVREIVHEERQYQDGQDVVDAFAFDPKRSKIVWSSPGLTLVGDQASYRRAHLGGKPENGTVQTAVADVVSRLDRQGRGEWQCCR